VLACWLGRQVHVGSVTLRGYGARLGRGGETLPVAVKRFYCDDLTEQVISSFRNEANYLGALKHPNIVEVVSAASQNGHLSSRGGCQDRWHSLVNCNHGDSTTSRCDSPGTNGRAIESPCPPQLHTTVARRSPCACGHPTSACCWR
jgi:hypothetical protein